MSKSQQFLEQEGRYGVSGEVCFHFPLDTDDFFIDVILWIVSLGQDKGDPRNHTNSHEQSTKQRVQPSRLRWFRF